MLEEMRIAGLGVISEAVLEFDPGLTVVTGETGAGKTMLVTGLGLLFGGRADSSRLRPGVEAASVEGRLLVKPASEPAELVAEAGGDIDEDGSLVLRRVVTSTGRSRAAAGGAAVPASVLARLAGSLVAIHGQSDQQRLTQPAEQRQALDRYAGLDLSDCRQAFADWRAAVAELDRRSRDARALAREAELLRHGIAEIEAVAPEPGEDVELARLAERLEHADALRVAARLAHNALLGDPDDPAGEVTDVQTLLGLARRALGQVGGTDPALDALDGRLAELVAAAADLGAELADYEGQLDADPARLAGVHERRAALSGLTRKYGADLAAVLDWAAEAAQRLADADTSEDTLQRLAAERDRAAAHYAELAVAVSDQRGRAAEELSRLVTTELSALAMPTARVRFAVRHRPATEGSVRVLLAGTPVGAGPDGIDEVELTLQSHPDAPELPVQRGASGGELSRVMLAIEVGLADANPMPSMVFDEVDAGVGGRAAVEIGRRLALLARDRQVIVVTHLAQVASFADRHLVVDKMLGDPAGGVTRSDIRQVQGKDRLAELARMLAGDDTAVAREHAAELLEAARADRAARLSDGRRQRTSIAGAAATRSAVSAEPTGERGRRQRTSIAGAAATRSAESAEPTGEPCKAVRARR
jgi:DNA repair protein RecN (Recombination protein N)